MKPQNRFPIASIVGMAVIALFLAVGSSYLFVPKRSIPSRFIGAEGKIEAVDFGSTSRDLKAKVVVTERGGALERFEVLVHREEELRAGDSIILAKEPAGLYAVRACSSN